MKPAGTNRRHVGKEGEQLAEQYLVKAGYAIEARNWRCRRGELDLVARHEGRLVFVEVRTRRHTRTFGTAAESVDGRKQRQVREVAQHYLYQTRQTDVPLRFDVIAVQWDEGAEQPKIQHVSGAF